MNENPKAFCMFCGHPLPLWFALDGDDGEKDERYEEWLDRPCRECGKTPRQAGAK
jgi:hypothetical protein